MRRSGPIPIGIMAMIHPTNLYHSVHDMHTINFDITDSLLVTVHVFDLTVISNHPKWYLCR